MAELRHTSVAKIVVADIVEGRRARIGRCFERRIQSTWYRVRGTSWWMRRSNQGGCRNWNGFSSIPGATIDRPICAAPNALDLAMPSDDKNVLGGTLVPCSMSPRTGFYRDGCCNTGPDDVGLHVVCVQVTEEFLAFALERGNDLITPVPEFGFPGLEPGNRWCVCVATWREALEAGVAAPVVLAATHEETLAVIPLDALKRHALDLQ